jgi:hypothetical protein
VCEVPADEGCCRPELCVATDEDGRFVLPGGGGASAALVASAAGHHTRRLRRDAAESAASSSPSAELRIELDPGGEELHGSVEDALGGSVAGAAVSVLDVSSQQPQAVAFSRNDGSFAIAAPRGTVRLCARADGYSLVCRAADAPSAANRLVLLPESSVVGRVVRTGTGEPIEGATVTASNRDGLRVPAASVRSAADGTFALAGLPAGGYLLVAAARDARSREAWVSVGAGQTSDPVTLTASPAATLDGNVVVGTRPCREGFVEVQGPTFTRAALDASGGVHIEGLLPGTYRATASCGDGGPRSLLFEATNEPVQLDWSYDASVDDTPEQNAVLPEQPAGGTIQVSVTESGPAGPAGSWHVLARSSDPVPLRARRRGSDYVFDELPNGQYSIFEADHADAAQTVSITRAGQVARVSLHLPRPLTLSGRVLDDGGQPVTDAWVTHRRADSAADSDTPREPQLTNADGEFVLQVNADVPYTLSATSPSGAGQVSGVRAGTEAMLRVALPASLSGTVHVGDEQPVREFTVTYHRTDEPGWSVVSGYDSAFYLPALPPGDYELSVRATSGAASQRLALRPGEEASVTIGLLADGATALAMPQ